MYDVQLDERLAKDLRNAPQHVEERFFESLGDLATDPFRGRPGLDVSRVAGAPGRLKLRIGRWRFFYQVDQSARIVRVTNASPRPTAYR